MSNVIQYSSESFDGSFILSTGSQLFNIHNADTEWELFFQMLIKTLFCLFVS